MLKTKERRDTFLLVTMAIVFVIFLLYMFVPLKKQEKKSAPTRGDSRIEKKKVEEPVPKVEARPPDDYLGGLNQKLESELGRSFGLMLDSPLPFRNYPVENLKLLLNPGDADGTSKEDSPVFFEFLKKVWRIGFYDLPDLFKPDSDPIIDKRLKFNIYVALFMIKLQEEAVLDEIAELPDVLFKKIVNCRPYLIIDNEVNSDFQCFPVLFYFYRLMERFNLFPQKSISDFFCERIRDICDLSPGKYITQINDLLSFSKENQKFRISWTEEDNLNPDDQETYANLMLNVFIFLKQRYLIFPDDFNKANNRWLEELKKSDSGDIELIDLKISSEDAARDLQVQKIFYMPGKSQFVALLKGVDFSLKKDFLYRILHHRSQDFLKVFLQVDFASKFLDPESFQKELLNFGIYLKTQVPVD